VQISSTVLSVLSSKYRFLQGQASAAEIRDLKAWIANFLSLKEIRQMKAWKFYVNRFLEQASLRGSTVGKIPESMANYHLCEKRIKK